MQIARRTNWFVILTLAIPLIAGSAAYAQDQNGPPPGGPGGASGDHGPGPGGRRGPMSPDDRLKMLTTNLDLTNDQQTKIKPILESEQKKMEDLRNNSSDDRQAMRQKFQQLRDDTNSQIRALLDDKQKPKFDKMLQDEQQRMGQRGHMGGPGGQGGGPDNGSGGQGQNNPPQN